jgi:hypothetical protein
MQTLLISAESEVPGAEINRIIQHTYLDSYKLCKKMEVFTFNLR